MPVFEQNRQAAAPVPRWGFLLVWIQGFLMLFSSLV